MREWRTQGRRDTLIMHGWNDVRNTLEPCSAMWIMTTRTWLTKRTAHSHVCVHVRCDEGALGLGGHVVIGVVLCFTTHTQCPRWSHCHWCRAPFHHTYAITSTYVFLSFVVHFCTCSQTVFCDRQILPVAIYCTLLHRPIYSIFDSAKTVFWGVVFTLSVGYSRPTSDVNDQSVKKTNWIHMSFSEESFQILQAIKSSRSLNTWCTSVLTFGKIKSPPWTLPIPPYRRWTACLPLLVFVRVSRHLWFFSCFLLQSLQSRQCLLEIRSMPQWHSIRTSLIGMKPTFALKVKVFLCGRIVSVIFIRKSIPSSTKIFVSMTCESVMDSLLFACLLQLVSRVVLFVSRLFTISTSMKSSLLDILRDWKEGPS